MATKVWFITGASRGFGQVWAKAALARGDQVAATARDITALTPLVEAFGDSILPLVLDVTDRQAATEAVEAAVARFGRIDVAVNNAGYGLFGTIEEVSEADARAQMEVNFFGTLWITQAVLPHMRARGAGHIVQVSSIGGVNAYPITGLYHASKWALEAMSQSLASEVTPFGIKVTLVEPSGFATEWAKSSAKRAKTMPMYDPLREARVEARRHLLPGDPEATGLAILKVVDAENPPLRVFFGSNCLAGIKAEYASRLALWDQWQPVALEAQGDLVARLKDQP